MKVSPASSEPVASAASDRGRSAPLPAVVEMAAQRPASASDLRSRLRRGRRAAERAGPARPRAPVARVAATACARKTGSGFDLDTRSSITASCCCTRCSRSAWAWPACGPQPRGVREAHRRADRRPTHRSKASSPVPDSTGSRRAGATERRVRCVRGAAPRHQRCFAPVRPA